MTRPSSPERITPLEQAPSDDIQHRPGLETHAVLEPADLSSEQIDSPFKDLVMNSGDVAVNQSPMIEIEVRCLP